MEGLRERKKADKQRRILSAALIEYATNGYTNTSLAAVAKRAGVSYGLVPRHFGSKDELYCALIDRSFDMYCEKYDLQGSFATQFMSIVHEIKSGAISGSDSFKFLFLQFSNKDVPPASVDHLKQGFKRTNFYQLVKEAMEIGIIPGSNPSYVMFSFLSSAATLTKAYVDLGINPPDDAEYMKLIGWQVEPEEQYEEVKDDPAYKGSAELTKLKRVLRNHTMFQILASEYTGFYYVNLVTGEYDVYSLSERIISDTGQLLKKTMSFQDAYRQFVEMSVHPEDRQKLLNVLNNIRQNLAHHKSLSLFFRRNYDGEYLYTEMYCVKIDNLEDPATEITVGFTEKDKQHRMELASLKVNQTNQEVITTLVSQFDAVYFYDFAEGKMIPYLTSPAAEQLYGERLNDGSMSISEIVRLFTECIVYPADRDKIRAITSIESLTEKLADRKSVQIIFRRRDEYGIRYSLVEVIKLNNVHDTPTAVAFAFKYRDDEVIGQYINERFIGEYDSIYFVDMENDLIRSFKESEYTDIGRFKVANYHTVALRFAERVAPQYRHTWESLADPVFIRNFLGDEDSREFVYQIADSQHEMRRGQLHVVERKEGIPVSLIISFIGIDKITSEKMRLDAKVAEQKRALEQQQVKLEKALEKAEAANMAKTSFLSNMSHDIRTPMNAIMGFTNLALENIDDSEKIKDYLLKTSLSSRHLLSLINDILDMSRIESGKTVINNASMDMRVFADNCRSIIMGLLTDRDLEYTEQIEPLDHPVVLGDELHMRQILLNILGNAVKYTLDGGKICFRMCESEVTDDTVTYRISVEDNGIGMKKEFLGHIFEPFSQETEGARTQYKGTGLGMAITKKLVDMMNGRIEVESEYEVGSKFTVTIPFTIDKDSHIVRHRHTSRGIRGLKVLVVEDNELNREIAGEVLKGAGTSVEYANNGAEAVEIFEKSEPGRFDIILMDIMMPVMDGIEATRRIRALDREDAAQIPIIAMTANAFDEDVRKVKEAGMNAHVAKPVDTSILVRAIANCVQGRNK